jgi:hypothetical protein
MKIRGKEKRLSAVRYNHEGFAGSRGEAMEQAVLVNARDKTRDFNSGLGLQTIADRRDGFLHDAGPEAPRKSRIAMQTRAWPGISLVERRHKEYQHASRVQRG